MLSAIHFFRSSLVTSVRIRVEDEKIDVSDQSYIIMKTYLRVSQALKLNSIWSTNTRSTAELDLKKCGNEKIVYEKFFLSKLLGQLFLRK